MDPYSAGLVAELCGAEAAQLRKAGVEPGRLEELCRFKPSTPEEAAAFLKGLFESSGELFDPDPHAEGNLIVIFRGARAAEALDVLGIEYLATTDESGRRPYVVVYEPGEVAKLLRLIKPEIPEPLRRKASAYL